MGYKYTQTLTKKGYKYKQQHKKKHSSNSSRWQSIQDTDTYKYLEKFLKEYRKKFKSLKYRLYLRGLTSNRLTHEPIRMSRSENRELFILDMDRLISNNVGLSSDKALRQRCLELIGQQENRNHLFQRHMNMLRGDSQPQDQVNDNNNTEHQGAAMRMRTTILNNMFGRNRNNNRMNNNRTNTNTNDNNNTFGTIIDRPDTVDTDRMIQQMLFENRNDNHFLTARDNDNPLFVPRDNLINTQPQQQQRGINRLIRADIDEDDVEISFQDQQIENPLFHAQQQLSVIPSPAFQFFSVNGQHQQPVTQQIEMTNQLGLFRYQPDQLQLSQSSDDQQQEIYHIHQQDSSQSSD